MGKSCCLCGVDVSDQKRVKDAQGRYYCQACYGRGLAAISGRSGETPGVVSSSSAPPDADYEFVDEEGSGSLPRVSESSAGDLEELDGGSISRAPGVTSVSSRACAGCGGVFSHAQTRFYGNGFYCLRCYAQRAAPQEDRDIVSAGGGAESSIARIMVTSGVVLLSAWGLLTLAAYAGQGKAGYSAGVLVVLGGVMTGVAFMQAVLLVGSMLVTDRIFGGTEFGTIEQVIWKSMLLTTLMLALKAVGSALGSASFFMSGFSSLILLVGFMALFHLDLLEAVVLSVVNWFISLFLGTALVLMIMTSLASLPASSSGPEEINMEEVREEIEEGQGRQAEEMEEGVGGSSRVTTAPAGGIQPP